MKILQKPIFTGFAPNLTGQDVRKAASFLFLPWRWKFLQQGESVAKVEAWLKDFFSVREAITFDSGRSALYFALRAWGVGEGDEVLVQSYTCLVVVNAICWTGAKPVYVDIENDFNMAAADLLKKVTPRSKVLIIQHTFGQAAALEKLLKIAAEHNLYTIEDCAHALGARYQGKLLGTFANVSMLSFGSDKVVSCGRGGALILNDNKLAEKIRQFQQALPPSPLLKIFQHLGHYLFFYFCKPLYNLGVGKWVLALAKKLNFYNKIIYPEEKLGLPVAFYPAQFSNALADILLLQLETLNQTLRHQQKIAVYYQKTIINSRVVKPVWSDDSIWLRYTILVNNPTQWRNRAKKQGILLGNWYDAPVAPQGIDLENFGYQLGSCPHDEELAQKSLNLPTDRQIDLKAAQKVVEFINNYAN